MRYIHNPVLSGFNPDPSILRVNEDYYIATSTFEWFPGVQIHHSKDLINWKLVARPLNRVSQVDMKGNPNSGGIWAPCLSYNDGIFYLIYTDVKCHDEGIFDDTNNYLVTTKDIYGEWSDPIYLNSSGFDPSLFHDGDGRKWLVNMTWDFRPWKNSFGGVLLQEYSEKEKRLVGPITNIFSGTKLGATEAPHLYRRDGYYYLITAEGGTLWEHAVSMARSENITGPYEVDPENPILTSINDCTLELQKSGHASLVETHNGEWYMAHLCGRPIPSRGRCILGRETAIQKVKWTQDGWLRLDTGGNKPFVKVPAPNLPEYKWEKEKERDDFDSNELNIHFQTLRIPLGEDVLTLTERQGYLRLRGRESLSSLHTQSLVARRQQAFCFEASTCLEFEPRNYQQMAGLVYFYDTKDFYYLHVTHDEDEKKCLNIMNSFNGKFNYPLKAPVSIAGWRQVYLKLMVKYDRAQFFYSKDGKQWEKICDMFDCSNLSDEHCQNIGILKFTGAFVGMCCQDLSGQRLPADFDYFEYIEK